MKRLAQATMVVGMVLFMSANGLAVEKFEVDGIEVIVKTNTANEIIAADLYLKGGTAYYGTDLAGIEEALFSAAMEGTKNYPKDKLRSELARMGTSISSSAGHDYTSVNMQCLKRYLDDSWKIFADVVVNPLLDSADVELVTERQLNDIRQTEADPDGYARIIGERLFFRNHPYAVSPSGTEETVAALNAKVLKDYQQKQINRARLLVVFVGDVDKETATRLVKAGLGALPAGSYSAPALPTPGGMTGVENTLEARELPTVYVRGYYPAPSPDNIEDAIPMFVGLDILRDRLFKEVRTKRNLTYAVSSSMANRRTNYGLLYVTSTDPAQAVSVMLDEVERIQTEPVPEKDLRDKIKVLTTETLMAEQTNSSQASRLALYELNGQDWELAEKRMELIQKVTPEEIQRVMKKYVNNVNFCVLGDTTAGRAMLDAVAAR